MVAFDKYTTPAEGVVNTDADSITKFLNQYYGEDYETSTLVAIKETPKKIVKGITVDEVQEYNSKGYNIYFSVNPTYEKMDTKPSKKDIKSAKYLHLDIDPVLDGKYSKELREKLLSLAETEPCTFAIDSGNGIGLFWRVEDGLSVEDVEAMNRELIKKYGGDVGTHNIDRIMRLPYTMNHPSKTKLDKGYGVDSVPSSLLKATGEVFKSSDFEKMEVDDIKGVDATATNTEVSSELLDEVLDDIDLIDSDDMSVIDYAFAKDYIRGVRVWKMGFIPTLTQMRDALKAKGLYELREERRGSSDKYKRDTYLRTTIHKAVNKLRGEEFDGVEYYDDFDNEGKPLTLEMLYKHKVAVNIAISDLEPLHAANVIFNKALHLFFAPSGYHKSFTVAKLVGDIKKDKFYLDFEHNPSNLKRHCEEYGIEYATPANTMKELKTLLKMKADFSNALFIFDSFSNLIAEGNNDATDTANVVKLMHQLCVERDATVIFIDHATKIDYHKPKDWNFKLEGNESGKKKPCELVYMIQPNNLENYEEGVKLLTTKSRTPLRMVNKAFNPFDNEIIVDAFDEGSDNGKF